MSNVNPDIGNFLYSKISIEQTRLLIPFEQHMMMQSFINTVNDNICVACQESVVYKKALFFAS